MLHRFFKIEAPKGLSEEQLKFWEDRFVNVFKNFERFDVKIDGRGNMTMDLSFVDRYHLYFHMLSRSALEAGEWFVTQLMMDPVSKETGPLFNKPENLPQLITAAGRFSFFVTLVEADPVRIQLLLHRFEPVDD